MIPTRKRTDKIIIHCSDTDNPNHDSAAWVRRLHLSNGWKDIGYQFFIRKSGGVELGRPEMAVGAHTEGENSTSIGICVSGRKKFTTAQFISLAKLVYDLQVKYNISDIDIYPHNHFNQHKTCPNFELKEFMEFKTPYRRKL